MNKTILFLLMLLGVSAHAANLQISWDASPTPGVTNYTLYAHTNTLTATNLAGAVVKVNVGTNLSVAVLGLPSGQWKFVVTATKSGLESDPSVTLPVEVPVPPPNLRTVIIEWSTNLTNWTDLGFFKLKIQ